MSRIFSKLKSSKNNSVPESIDPLVIIVSRIEVETCDTSAVLSTLTKLTQSPAMAKQFMERVDIAFQGYDEITLELFEIDKVRDFVFKLDDKFPFWLFFLSKRHLGLQCILWCLLPPFLTAEGRAKIFPERINHLLINRWLPAMNHICAYTGCSEAKIEMLTERALKYITNGRFPIESE